MADRVVIEPPRAEDQEAFLVAVRRSRRLHHPWVQPPATAAKFGELLGERERFVTFLIWTRAEGGLVGVCNISEIVRGSFLSGYLGYYGFEPYAGSGLMSEGLSKVIEHAFRRLKLHRLEANIQPGNARSKRFAKRLGFRREGFSPRYLKINGRWRDHERWALLAEDW
jgi:ribosomal-protein-alanine N-acetyltransferase